MKSAETIFRQYLKEKGMLVSRQREQVLAAFIKTRNHPTVDDIYNAIRKKNLKIGLAIGIATISDSLIPYLGEILLHMPNRGIHIGFIEKWWLVNPLAILGVVIAHFWTDTKFPHAGHVLLSTWASLFHIIMAKGEVVSLLSYTVIFLFLFLAVWLPCCLSDIVFPLVFVKESHSTKNL